MVCSVNGCKNQKIAAKGLCWTHYRRLQKHGSVEGDFINHGKSCYIDGCDKPAYIKGLCVTHRFKTNRYGDPFAEGKPSIKGKNCVVDGCNEEVRSSDLCKNHYANYIYYRKSKGVNSVKEYLEEKQ